MPDNSPVTIPQSDEFARIRADLLRLMETDLDAAGRVAAELFITPVRYPVSPKEQAVIDAAPLHMPLTTRRGKDFVLHQWPGDGPRVLLVHGWEQTAGRFVALIQALQKAGYAVAALDAPAHGASPGTQCGMADFMDAAQTSIGHIGGVHALIGHSLGGSAILFALSMLPGMAASRVVTIGAFDRVHVIFDAWIYGMGLPDEIFMPMVRRYKETYGVWSPDFVAEKHAPSLRVPALIVHDRDDNVIPFACGEALAALWPGARFMPTERLRHYLTLRNAGVVSAVVEFIGEGQPS